MVVVGIKLLFFAETATFMDKWFSSSQGFLSMKIVDMSLINFMSAIY